MAANLIWLTLGLCVAVTLAMPREDLYPYGTEHGDRRVAVGDDISSPPIPLRVPIAFYSDIYESIYVNVNGLLSFRTPVADYDADLQMPFNHPVIAPFFTDVDTRLSGNVFYRETLDPDTLTTAAQKIWQNFPRWRDYEPISLLIITWDNVGYYNQKADEVNTFQVVIASDGDNSFVFLHYPNDGLNWIQSEGKDGEDLPAQAGFDSGDGRSKLMPASGTGSAKNLYGWSNIRQRGVWIFRVGNVGQGRILSPGDDEVEEEEKTTPGPAPTSCAAGGDRMCDESAQCSDYQGGYCCHCRAPAVGNGHFCLTPSEPQRLSGTFSGEVNGETIDPIDMHAYVVLSDGRTYTSIGRISQSLGFSMQSLYPIGAVLGFSYALPKSPAAMNGFMATGGDFNMSATIRFADGNKVMSIQQTAMGQDDQGKMRINTQVRGDIPIISEEASMRVDDFKQDFMRVSQGVIRSNSQQMYRIDGTPYRFSIELVINYKECDVNPLVNFGTMRVSATRHFITYNTEEEIVRFVQINRVSSVVGMHPCQEAHKVCDANADCVPNDDSYQCVCRDGFMGDGQTCNDYDECRRNMHDCDENAECINTDGGFECRCQNGYIGDGRDCTREMTCADIDCHYNAHCVFDIEQRTPICECNAGFIGDGTSCRPDVFDCNEVDNCDANADCEYIEESGKYECVCNDGYSGDGLSCTDTGEPTDCQRCDVNARCQYDVDRLVFRCQCLPDYSGDGYTCNPIAIPCNVLNNCDYNAQCLYNTDTYDYQCQCREGYHGDGIVCEEASCETANNCGPNARCLYDGRISGYHCVCNPGFLGDGYRCQAEGCDVLNDCDQNAQCVRDARTQRYGCVCNEGYEGDGKACRLTAIPCNQLNNCDINADCMLDPNAGTYICQCKQGYEGDGYSCRLSADCRRDYRACSPDAQCVPRGTDYICVCNAGFRGNGYQCQRVADRSSYLLYAQGNSILSVPFQPSQENPGEQVFHQPGMLAVGIDVDCYERDFYWTDVAKGTISKAKLDGSDVEVVHRGLRSPEGVAIDWSGKNMYWTDSEVDRIESSRLDGTNRKNIISDDLVNPRAIAVDPIRGLLFWADWNRGAPKIERSYMDGSNRVTLLDEGLGLPNGLTIDFDTYYICWADAGTMKIECANYEGKARRTVFGSASYPFGITFANNVFYWTDWDMKTLPNVNQFADMTNEALVLPPGGNGRMYGITTVKTQCPRGSNACALNNGGCRFLCLPTPNGGRTCQCPDDIEEEECNRVGLLL